MKSTKIGILFLFLLCIGSINAQFSSGYGWKVPRKSPQASTTQTVGITTIQVNYSRPFVSERKVWGEEGIVPFDKVWRAGANEATTINFNTDVLIDTVVVKKGKYGLFVIPNATNQWIVIINKVHKQWGAFTYNKEKDVVRTKVTVNQTGYQESLLFSFNELKNDSTVLGISWGNKRINLPISVDLTTTIKTSTVSAFDWQAGFFAAQYYLNELENYDEALKWVNASLALNVNLSSLNQKADILAKMENWKEAIKVGERILELGKNSNRAKFFTEKIKPLLKLWNSKLNK